MPYLNIVTNKPVNDESALLQAASQTISKAAGKPETYIMVSVDVNPNMRMSASDAPLAFLDYRALGLPANRGDFSDVLCSLITEHLDIQGDRIYISMTDSERQNWGWNHSTF